MGANVEPGRVYRRPGSGPQPTPVPTRGDIAAALYRSPAAADVVDGFGLSTSTCNELADAVLALLQGPGQ